MVTRGFEGRRRPATPVPPGQYVTDDFPVLTAGPTVEVTRDEWRLTVTDGGVSTTFDWDDLAGLEQTTWTGDIHCVTHWTKLATTWTGVRLDTLFDAAGVGDRDYAFITSYGDYTTNLPATDLVDTDAMVATAYEGDAIDAEHGGPVRLFVPHLYFWKSAKWVREIRLSDDDEPGFWEAAGYHHYGDPWREERYAMD